MAGTSVLNGVRVIDFGQYIAGPMSAMFLADQGADVIRIDPPGGPRWNTPANATWNRGKRSIMLDLKKESDRDIARRLVESADVVVENFRPGVMERLGLGHAAMTAANPRLIYCSLPGFGHDDPRAGVRAWEGVVGAATGAYRVESSKAARPVYTVIPFSSVYAAFLSAVSIAMALNARERGGFGQRIEIPLFDATFTALGARGLTVHNHPEVPPPFNWSRQLPTKDGRWFMYVFGNKKFETFIDKIGMAEHRKAGLSPEELGKRFDDIGRQRTAKEWEDYCAELGTEGVICHSSAEWLQHPQALESKIIADFDDPELGKFRGPGITPRLSETPGAIRSPRPRLDANRAEILQALSEKRALPAGATETELRAALQGVKVIDLCIILAGPTCGRTLAEFGADVIKIDSPYRDPVQRHNDINRAKRSILLDLKTEEGLKIFWRLVDEADVVLQNFRMGIAEKLGIGYEQVKARRPDIVYCSMNTFGHVGPYATRPGHEQIAQAVSGMQVRYGSNKPVTAPFAANDYGTGLMGCYAVALALLHRRRTGQGQKVDSALAYTATMLQTALLQDYPGKQWNEPHGQEALGSGPLYRLYEASDGWLFMAAQDGQLQGCAELADLAGQSGADLEKTLEVRFSGRKADEWVTVLTRAGIGAHRCSRDSFELMDDPIVRQRGLSITREHDEIGPVTTTGPGPRLSRTPLVPGRPAPKPGSDAASVLKDIGMEKELDRLVAGKVIRLGGITPG